MSHGSHGETKIIELLSNAGIDFEQEYSFSDLISNDKKLRFDFYLPKQNYLIEFDGRQHFPNGQNTYWDGNDTYETIHKRDMMKSEYCLTHNIPLIRIPYTRLSKMTLSDLLLEKSEFVVKEV
nr:MAG TPA: restriction enzyme [Caudoviricetes sp.]